VRTAASAVRVLATLAASGVLSGAYGQTLAVDRTSVSMLRLAGGPPVAQTLSLTSSGGSTPFQIVAVSAPWLDVSPLTGSTPATLTLTANPAGLPAGTYSYAISIFGGTRPCRRPSRSGPKVLIVTVGEPGASSQAGVTVAVK